jgi:hypothetical protein
MSIIIPANSAVSGGDQDNSLRFNKGSSDYLNRTFGTSTSEGTWTYSVWLKISDPAFIDNHVFFSGGGASDNRTQLYFGETTGTLNIYRSISGSTVNLESDASFRDPSAWYNLCVQNNAGTVAAYINGVAVTLDGNSLGTNVINKSDTVHKIGRGATGTYTSSYMSEIVFIDGTVVAPTGFGEFDDSGIWKPIDVSGLTFGNNGFYLDFEDSSALGDDVSGNGNDFTVNNLTAIDQSTDTPTNNFCTLNPLTKRSGGTLTEGNLQYTASTADSSIFGTMAIPPGMKVYFEVKLVSNTAQNSIGIHSLYDGGDGAFVKGGSETGTYSFKPRGSGSVTQYFNNGSSTDTSIDNPANNTILGVAINNNNGQIHYHIAGTYINSSDPTDNDPVALVTGFGGATEQYLHFSLDTTTTQPSNQFNFGSPPYSESGGNSDGNGYGNFAHAVPSGYYALNTKNLAEYG